MMHLIHDMPVTAGGLLLRFQGVADDTDVLDGSGFRQFLRQGQQPVTNIER